MSAPPQRRWSRGIPRAGLLFIPFLLMGAVSLRLVARDDARPPAGEPAAPAAPLADDETCVVREVSRRHLFLQDGRRLYVEPVALSPSRDALFMAGTYTHVWHQSGREQPAADLADSIFGVVIPDSGALRVVPVPRPVAPERIVGIRALARSDGTWAVVWSEQVPGTAPEDPVARLWYGVFDGRRWTTVDTIPRPPSVVLSSVHSSALVAAGDTLAWALPATPEAHGGAVLVYLRTGSAWSYELIPAFGAAYTALAHSPADGFVIAVVRPDTTQLQDANSLFLYARSGGWEQIRLVARGALEPVHHPSLSLTPSPGALTWQIILMEADGKRIEVRALFDPLSPASAQAIVLDATITRVTPLATGAGRRVWVVDHNTPGTEQHELRFIAPSGREITELGSYESPFFAGLFGAAALPSGDVIVSGPTADTAKYRYPHSLSIRYRLQCTNEGE